METLITTLSLLLTISSLKEEASTWMEVLLNVIIISKLSMILTSSDLSDASSLSILFLGNYTELSPPQSLLEKLSEFLQYAVDLGKLTEDYLLYGERQFDYTTSPGDKLYEVLQQAPFDLHFDTNKATEGPCTIGCG